jgi:magnesium-transporting ATPase (P-type)
MANKVKIEEGDIVVGDVIYLRAGIRIPVDGIFVIGNSLYVNESSISGETQNVSKKPIHDLEDDSCSSILISHTNITNGCGWMVAVSIGDKSFGYARQCVLAHHNQQDSHLNSLSRTKLEFLKIGYYKAMQSIYAIIIVLFVLLIVVYLYKVNQEYLLLYKYGWGHI